MMDLDIKHLLMQAKQEIESLRRHNEILAARNDVVEIFAMAVDPGRRHRSIGMGEDIAWRIAERLREEECKEAAERAYAAARAEEAQ